jgi:tetratricopeptide (TPR) repeat protein
MNLGDGKMAAGKFGRTYRRTYSPERRVVQFCVTLFAALSAALTSGCATSSLRVVSTPDGADVSLIGADRAPVVVGKTPLDIDQKNYPTLFQESVQVQVTKEGHSPLSVLVPRLPNGGTGRILVNLQTSTLPKVCQNQTESVNQLAKGIADSASFVQRKRLDEASKLLEELAAKFGTVPVIYDLLGNVYYLQKNLPRSLDAYKKSNRLNANNSDTIRMIERIEQLQGRSSIGE